MTRLAMVAPLNSRATGVADYTIDLLPHLAEAAGCEIQVFSSDEAPTTGVRAGWVCHPIADLPRLADGFDLIIYQVGNSPAHDFMVSSLMQYPGLTVLHDVSLHNFFARQATARRSSAYWRALGFAHGLRGVALGWQYIRQPMPVEYPEYLVSEWLAARSLGVMVHSRHAASVLEGRCPAARVFVAPMPMPAPARLTQLEARARLGIPEDAFVLIVFGMLNPGKHPIAILDALSRLHQVGIPARVVFVGPENYGFRLAPEVKRRDLQPAVTHLSYVELAVAQMWMFAADVGLGLRKLYFGETSASALRVLATGTPMIVNNVGAFAELPDTACIKVEPQEEADLVSTLSAALQALYRQPDRRRTMGESARAYVAQEHDPRRAAAQYLSVVQDILGVDDVRSPTTSENRIH